MRLRSTIDSAFSLSALPASLAVALIGAAAALVAADWLPENRYVDGDRLEFALTVTLGAAALAIAPRDRLDAAALAQRLIRALLVLTMLVVSMAVAEPMTRWLFRDVTTSSDNGGFFSKRWARTGAVHLNSARFRERESPPRKPVGTYRVAVVGDSFTFGNGLPKQDRYSDLLQARLPDHFEVLNFGVAGANTPQERSLLNDLLTNVQPDFVLLQWYVNDVEGDDSTGRPTFRPLMPIRALHDWLRDASALYTVASMKWAEAQVALGMTESYSEYLHRRVGDPNSPDAQVDRRTLLELIEVCKRAGVPIGIVLFPDTAGDLGAGYQFAYLHERVLDVCRAQHLTCVDLRSDFALVKNHQLLWASQLDHHPSALANEIAAVKIFETYSRQWAAPPQATPPTNP